MVVNQPRLSYHALHTSHLKHNTFGLSMLERPAQMLNSCQSIGNGTLVDLRNVGIIRRLGLRRAPSTFPVVQQVIQHLVMIASLWRYLQAIHRQRPISRRIFTTKWVFNAAVIVGCVSREYISFTFQTPMPVRTVKPMDDSLDSQGPPVNLESYQTTPHSAMLPTVPYLLKSLLPA